MAANAMVWPSGDTAKPRSDPSDDIEKRIGAGLFAGRDRIAMNPTAAAIARPAANQANRPSNDTRSADGTAGDPGSGDSFNSRRASAMSAIRSTGGLASVRVSSRRIAAACQPAAGSSPARI